MAVLVSAVVHVVFGLVLWTLSTTRSRLPDDKPLAEILVVVVPDEPLTVSLRTEPVRRASGTPNSESTSESEATPIQVQPLPVDTGSQTPSANVPRVVSPSTAGSTGGDGNTSNEAPTFLGVQLPARSVVFLIDRSMSMWFNNGLEAAKRELATKLERLPATTRYQVLFYDDKVVCFASVERDGLLPNTEETRRQITALMKSIHARGATDHLAALLRALALRPEAILFITDADDFRRDQVRTITDANQGKTAVHALQWSLTAAENESLKELARLNRGTYRQLGP
jgi:hypothetical protein